jgi:hypothetical protein
MVYSMAVLSPQQVVHRLTPLYTDYPGRKEKQGTPYSYSALHRVLPLACNGLGNIEHKHRLMLL